MFQLKCGRFAFYRTSFTVMMAADFYKFVYTDTLQWRVEVQMIYMIVA